jgi:hypothetical protein
VIELPAGVVPVTASAALVDAGGVMRSPLNTAALRVNRLGSHYRVALTFPRIDDPALARVIVSRLIRAQQEGLRTWFPTPEDQPVAGDVVVDGGGQSGKAIAVRGLYRQTAIREGWWLSIVDALGRSYLHNIAGGVAADGNGRAVLPLSEGLRAPFADGAAVRLVSPPIEGIVEGDAREWSIDVERGVDFTVTIEEAR